MGADEQAARPDSDDVRDGLDPFVRRTAILAAVGAALGAAVGVAKGLGRRSDAVGREGEDAMDEIDHRAEADQGDGDRDGQPRDARRSATLGSDVARRAKEQLSELTGREPDAVLGIEKRDDGWIVTIELVELARIPSSTDVLGSYAVHVDGEGNLQQYHRTGRYVRSRAHEEGDSP